MSESVFTQLRFWLLIAFSMVIPFAIYAVLMTRRAISRRAVFVLGLTLILIAGVDVYLLQALAAAARHTPSLVDDAIFLSEVTLALYLVPAMFGGTGANVVSHVIIAHLVEAEQRFEDERPPRGKGP